MKKELDIYAYRNRLETTQATVRRAPISSRNREQILGFLDACVLENMSAARTCRVVEVLRMLALILQRDFDSATKEDITRMVRVIHERDYSPWTRYTYKVILKRFHKWLKGNNEEYPPEVKWIKARVTATEARLPGDGDLLTEEEVDRMIGAADHPRDKAFLAVLYESGARIGEIGSLQIKDIRVDQHGMVLHLTGKTGQRPVRVVKSTPRLVAWLDSHPFRSDRNAALWLSLSTRRHHKPARYGALRNILHSAAQKAGITKPLKPHLFRHSRATFLADHLTEFQMNQFFGWVQGSGMPATYVHMNGAKVESAILALNGVKEPEAEPTRKTTRNCPRCNTINSTEGRFCMKCGVPLGKLENNGEQPPGEPSRAMLDAILKDGRLHGLLADILRERLSNPCEVKGGDAALESSRPVESS